MGRDRSRSRAAGARRRWRWRKTAFFVALSLFVLAFFTSLSLTVIAQHFTGHSAATDANVAQNPMLSSAGAVLDLSHAGPAWSSAPARTVALTFDDGPDPRWTPQILAVLARHHVPATFFLVGARVLENPGLVRRELTQHDEIGIHTFSHPQMGGLAAWQQDLQLSLTDKAIAGASGLHTKLYRPPYSGRPVDLSGSEYDAARHAARNGRFLVLADDIAFDWLPGSPAKLAANALPRDGASGVIMFHDAGGDRHRTVAAVDQLITTLQHRGYRFDTVSQFAALPRNAVLAHAGPAERVQGLTLIWAGKFAHWVTSLFGLLTALLLVVCIGRGIAVLVFARRHRRLQDRAVFDPTFTPPVSVVVPAYNESAGIAAAVRSIAVSDYFEFEVIVVDDGSTDGTAAIVERLQLARVRVLTQANGGKATALNTGIAQARHDVVVLVDADTVLEPATLRHLVQPLRDPDVGAVSGNAKVGNPRGLLGRWQQIEYVISCSVERRMFDVLECMPCVPGAVGAYRREAITSVGGLSRQTLAEDTDLTMAVQRAGWKVRYQADARAWTEVPTTLRDLWRQRYRWSYGTIQAMWKHRRAPVERGTAGHLGRRGIPYLTFYTVVLPVLSPAVDLFALYGILAVDAVHAFEMWAAVNVVTLVVGAYAFHLDEERPAPLLLLPLQQFVYRQMMYGVVLHALKSALLGIRVRWQRITRTGDFAAAPSADVRTIPVPSSLAGSVPTARPAEVAASTSRPEPAVAGAPIFVDDTRRRGRRAVRFGLAAAAAVTVAAGAVFASIALPSTGGSQLAALHSDVRAAPYAADVLVAAPDAAQWLPAPAPARHRPTHSPTLRAAAAPPATTPGATRNAVRRPNPRVPAGVPHAPARPPARTPRTNTGGARHRTPGSSGVVTGA